MNNLIGNRFGKLKVLSEENKIKGIRYFKCICKCGNIKITRGSNLKNGSCKSCGCTRNNKLSKIGKSKKTHGMSRTRFYKIWKGMRVRCYNKNAKEYRNYGGRGITICKEWNNFENFKRDMFVSYRYPLTIERIDNNGNYCKDNCKWITILEQSKNKRMKKLTKEKVLKIREELKYEMGKDIAKKYGISRGIVSEIKNFRRNYGNIY
jgi:hypothetical protein